MMLQNHVQTRLNPVLAMFGYCASFPEEEGTYTCQIHVDQGEIQLRHGAYNIETGCWDEEPSEGEIAELRLHEGETKELKINCRNHYGQSDDIWISNNSYLRPARFTCNYKKAS